MCERVWPRSRDQILSFFDGFELLEPGLVPKHQWRPVTGKAAVGTPNIQWGAVGREPGPGDGELRVQVRSDLTGGVYQDRSASIV